MIFSISKNFGNTGWEASMLPLCYAALPPQQPMDFVMKKQITFWAFIWNSRQNFHSPSAWLGSGASVQSWNSPKLSKAGMPQIGILYLSEAHNCYWQTMVYVHVLPWIVIRYCLNQTKCKLGLTVQATRHITDFSGHSFLFPCRLKQTQTY